MRHASLNARISRWAVTGLAATVLAIMALAAGPSAPAALANLDPAPAVSQDHTELPDVQTDATTPSDQDGGTAAGDGQPSDKDLLLMGEQDGLVATDLSFDGLDGETR